MNFSPDKFSYTVTEAVGREGVDIVLTRLETDETKAFYQAGARMPAVGLHSHMNSLTDDLMEQWFVQRERKPKKKKK